MHLFSVNHIVCVFCYFFFQSISFEMQAHFNARFAVDFKLLESREKKKSSRSLPPKANRAEPNDSVAI